MVVPKASIRDDAGRCVVFVLHNGRAERRAVTLNGSEGDDAVLTAGVSAGERVIIEASEPLTDGVLVKERNP